MLVDQNMNASYQNMCLTSKQPTENHLLRGWGYYIQLKARLLCQAIDDTVTSLSNSYY